MPKLMMVEFNRRGKGSDGAAAQDVQRLSLRALAGLNHECTLGSYFQGTVCKFPD
jgi:hypothetical protein